MVNQKKFPLGQMLVEKNIITQEQLELALKKQRESGELLGIVLLEMGFVDEEVVFLPVVAGQLGVDYTSLKEVEIPADVIAKIPPKFASHYKVIPLKLNGNVLTIATSRPLDVHLLDEISLVVSERLNPVLASERDILEAIRKYYGVGAETIETMMDKVDAVPASEQEDIAQIDEIESEASISKFINPIFLEAHRDRATDIHIEPFEDALHIRYRVDGILYDAKVPKNIKYFKDSINSRIKILSNLNIAEKRLPQDGRLKVKVGDADLDLRVSFLPTAYGESVVLRVLNSTRLYNFDELGLDDEEKKILEHLVKKPHGIIFVTGPTGSGKTTTLYACLASVNTEARKIITIEDPIEYQLKGIIQIPINPKVGLTFAQGLRSVLRHDPDVMMVGEVRDAETANIAIQAALTGHLMFSTLHTNDAASGVTRLIDMGVDPYLITSIVECFIAERLIRLICHEFKEAVKVTEEMWKDLKNFMSQDQPVTIYEGKGCDHCHLTGYMGRASIYEFLVMNDAIRQLVMERAGANQIKDAAVKNGMRTLLRAGWLKVAAGQTTLQEVLRITKEESG